MDLINREWHICNYGIHLSKRCRFGRWNGIISLAHGPTVPCIHVNSSNSGHGFQTLGFMKNSNNIHHSQIEFNIIFPENEIEYTQMISNA